MPSQEEVDQAKRNYLNDPTKTGLEDANFQLVAAAESVPVDDAKAAGLKKARDLLALQANLSLLGDEDASKTMSNPNLYHDIKVKGIKGVLADTAILPNFTPGISFPAEK